MSAVSEIRIRNANPLPPKSDGKYVVYWMTAFRRISYNFALQRAVEWSNQLNLPLVIFEALRCDYQWASVRFHQFFIDGMRDNFAGTLGKPVVYYPYLEDKTGAGKGLLGALAKDAAVVVVDDYPCIFLPKMVDAAANSIDSKMEAVDSNGVVPLRLAARTYLRAVDFRRFMQKNIRDCLTDFPEECPLDDLRISTTVRLPKTVLDRWPKADLDRCDQRWLASLPIDQSVSALAIKGGSEQATKEMNAFVAVRLDQYQEQRRNLDQSFTSGLSPYFRFGHISSHQVVLEVLKRERWSPAKMAEKSKGSSSDYWGTSAAAEAFLDELITWREIGFNMSSREGNYQEFESLPEWAQKTLVEHQADVRPNVYQMEEFETAKTHDDLWNAAQRQLVREGRIHNYMRMVWGKKILHWSRDPKSALEIMIHLNNKYAIDGRDPNSYSGIFWILGRYDRAWGPERKIFGKIRYMSEENTRKKLSVGNYLKTYASF